MPKRNKDEYEDDDGFVEDAPVSKAQNGSKKQRLSKPSSKPSGNMGNGPVPGGGQRGNDGEYWELSGKRRVQISKFNGKQMINIREYYEKDGQMLPGKKGISLTLEQFDTVVSLLPHIEAVLKDKGHTLKRPDYEGAAVGAELGDDEDEDEEEEAAMDDDKEDEDDGAETYAGEKSAKTSIRKNAVGRPSTKRNYEDTSEDE